jgi:hypothetical protein
LQKRLTSATAVAVTLVAAAVAVLAEIAVATVEGTLAVAVAATVAATPAVASSVANRVAVPTVQHALVVSTKHSIRFKSQPRGQKPRGCAIPRKRLNLELAKDRRFRFGQNLKIHFLDSACSDEGPQ